MIGRNAYEKMIPRREPEALEHALAMEAGYVLDFSDRTFSDLFYETIAIDPESHSQLFNGRGTSKAKRLLAFIECAQPTLVAKILRELWKYREAIEFAHYAWNEEKLKISHSSTVAFWRFSKAIDGRFFED